MTIEDVLKDMEKRRAELDSQRARAVQQAALLAQALLRMEGAIGALDEQIANTKAACEKCKPPKDEPAPAKPAEAPVPEKAAA